MAVVLEFGQREKIIPVILLFAYKEPNILVKFLVYLFSLSVDLQILSYGKYDPDFK